MYNILKKKCSDSEEKGMQYSNGNVSCQRKELAGA